MVRIATSAPTQTLITASVRMPSREASGRTRIRFTQRSATNSPRPAASTIQDRPSHSQPGPN